MILVRYVGRKQAPFEIEKLGKRRMWANVSAVRGAQVQRQRWLPDDEAMEYGVIKNFTLKKEGKGIRAPLPPPPGQRRVRTTPSPTPKPQAIPVRALLEAQKATEESLAQRDEPKVEDPPFLLSSSGMLHKRDCRYAPRMPIGEFWTLDDAATVPQFKKYHEGCVG